MDGSDKRLILIFTTVRYLYVTHTVNSMALA